MIAQEFANSTDRTAVNLAAQRAAAAAVWTCPDPVFSAWLAGMRMYDDGAPLIACTDDHQRRGWHASERAEAATLAGGGQMYERSIQ